MRDADVIAPCVAWRPGARARAGGGAGLSRRMGEVNRGRSRVARPAVGDGGCSRGARVERAVKRGGALDRPIGLADAAGRTAS